MALTANLFFESEGTKETLFSRISLSEEQIAQARRKKDDLLDFLKPELSSTLDVGVKHWLQGSYKNHTLIRPVHKGEEFDIDVGIYLFCNAEEEGLSATDVKSLNREILDSFSSKNSDANLEESKTNCERVSFTKFFHIDVPIYYFDEDTDTCKLASQDNGWIDSDPKVLQSWFDNAVAHLEPHQLARLRRVIKYLKCWTLLKSTDDSVKIPSVALTVLVTSYFIDKDDDDDALISTSLPLLDFILENKTLKSPVSDDDIFAFDDDQYRKVKEKAQQLKRSLLHLVKTDNSFEKYVIWTGIFEHLFPPFSERLLEVKSAAKVPAITHPPKIKVRHCQKNGELIKEEVTDSVHTCKGEKLYFSVANLGDYEEGATVHWVVRNQDKEASLINDMGHVKRLDLNEECSEYCDYKGKHYMECLIYSNYGLSGISAVSVTVLGYNRPPRTPKRKKYL